MPVWGGEVSVLKRIRCPEVLCVLGSLGFIFCKETKWVMGEFWGIGNSKRFIRKQPPAPYRLPD